MNYLALLGWSLDGETTIVPPVELCRHFSLERISKNPSQLDEEKLLSMNGTYLNAMTDAEFSQLVLVPQLVAAGMVAQDAYESRPAWFDLLSSILKPRVRLMPEVVEKSAFLFGELVYDEASVAKNLAKEGVRPLLQAAREALSALAADAWTADAIDAALEPLPERLGVGKRKVFQAVRVAECGNQVSPPLGASMELLGRSESLRRLEAAEGLALA